MENEILRVVPNIYSNNIEESKRFYVDFLEMHLVMDLGWVLTFASKSNPKAQLTVLQNNGQETLNNSSIFISIEVTNVNEIYDKARRMKLPITYDIRNEEWGVRRFFVTDPNGATINLLQHI